MTRRQLFAVVFALGLVTFVGVFLTSGTPPSSNPAFATPTPLPVPTFPPPPMAISIEPAQLSLRSEARIHARIVNATGAGWSNFLLAVGYGPEDDPRVIIIEEIPLTLEAGQTFERDVAWYVDYFPAPGAYQVRLVLYSSAGQELARAQAPMTLTNP
jgi:hypothetical protein